MKTKMETVFIMAVAVIFVIGIVILMCASNLGVLAGSAAIQANGGSMDTEQYYMIMKLSTVSYQIAGAILSSIGGLGSIVFGCLICNGKKHYE